MLKQIKPVFPEPPYYVCTKCNWAWRSLQEANQHTCGQDKPLEPAFRSYTK